jgi:hypothetical protein
MRWRGLLFAAILFFFATPRADASVSFTVVLDALVDESTAACVATPIDQRSVWEDGRIATYTRVHVDRVLAGSLSDEVWVKTLGGAVGDVGQIVDGEAVLRRGQQSVLFLSSYEGSLVVTARGQGQFPIVRDGAVLRLRKNAHAGALLAPNPAALAKVRARTTAPIAASPASDALDGKTIDDAAALVSAAWQRTHAHP